MGKQAKSPATLRKYADMQGYFNRRTAIMEQVGRHKVRKYTDDRVIAELMHKFYFDSPAHVWRILKMKLN